MKGMEQDASMAWMKLPVFSSTLPVGRSRNGTGKASPGVENTVRSRNRPTALRDTALPKARPVKPSMVRDGVARRNTCRPRDVSTCRR